MAYNPYYNNMSQPQMNYNNQFYNMPQQIPGSATQPQQQIPRIDPYIQAQPTYKPTSFLQGKSVDSIDVVKATDIPLDGSVNYFPLTDGSAIAVKQLQPDGTSKITIYKPIEEKEKEIKQEYITINDLEERLKRIDTKDDYKEELKNIKRTVEDLKDDIDKLKNRKDK